MKYFKAPLYRPPSADISFEGVELSPLPDREQLLIEQIRRTDGLHEALMMYYRDHGRNAGYLLLGWETWLQLGWELGSFRNLLKPNAFANVPIVVDPERKQRIQCLPGLDRVLAHLGRVG